MDVGYGMRDAGCKIQDAGYGMQDVERITIDSVLDLASIISGVNTIDHRGVGVLACRASK